LIQGAGFQKPVIFQQFSDTNTAWMHLLAALVEL